MDVVVIDSVAALTPRAEIEGEMGDAQMGLQARLMSQALRKLTAVISTSKTCCIFTNQLREKIGVMFGNPETTPGGKALKFYASVRLDIRRIGVIKDAAGHIIGNRTKVKVVKNKVAPPFMEAEFAFPGSARSSTRPSSTIFWRSAGPGSRSKASRSDRAAKAPSSRSRPARTCRPS